MKIYNNYIDVLSNAIKIDNDMLIIFKDMIIKSVDYESIVRYYSKRYVFDNVIFDNCVISNIDYRTCTLKNVTFDNCAFVDTIFDNCNTVIDRLIFKNLNLKNVLFDNATKSKCIFVNCSNVPGFHKVEEPFYGYKYTNHHLLILEIPEGATYFKSSSGKCRADRANVVSILNIDGSYSGQFMCSSWYSKYFLYIVGETVEPFDKFNLHTYECASGIHFFMTVKEAIHFFSRVIN